MVPAKRNLIPVPVYCHARPSFLHNENWMAAFPRRLAALLFSYQRGHCDRLCMIDALYIPFHSYGASFRVLSSVFDWRCLPRWGKQRCGGMGRRCLPAARALRITRARFGGLVMLAAGEIFGRASWLAVRRAENDGRSGLSLHLPRRNTFPAGLRRALPAPA